jgi:hypothetical protein
MGTAERQGTLMELVLDIPYLMEESGVIPPLIVLNQVLQSGGDPGGMGPGTTWQPFQIDPEEYAELMQALLHLDVELVRHVHPYVTFKQVIVDSDLDSCTEYVRWLENVYTKYSASE